MKNRRLWWATWLGAVTLGLLSLLMVSVTAVSLILVALLGPTDASGTDVTVADQPYAVWRVAYIIVGVLSFALPVVVVVVARRKWLGWVLATTALSAFVLAAGLWLFGIL